jgi:hypothetical protein
MLILKALELYGVVNNESLQAVGLLHVGDESSRAFHDYLSTMIGRINNTLRDPIVLTGRGDTNIGWIPAYMYQSLAEKFPWENTID